MFYSCHQLDKVVHTYNLSIQQGDVGVSDVQGQPRLYSDSLSKKKERKKLNSKTRWHSYLFFNVYTYTSKYECVNAGTHVPQQAWVNQKTVYICLYNIFLLKKKNQNKQKHLFWEWRGGSEARSTFFS